VLARVNRWIDRASQLLVHYRYLLVCSAIALTAATLPLALRVDFDARIETLFSPNDQLLQDYLASIATFGGDELIVLAYHDPELLSRRGLERQLQLIHAVEASAAEMVQTGIATESPFRSVTALANSPNPLALWDSRPLIEQIPNSGEEDPEYWRRLGSALRQSPLHRNIFIGDDLQTAAVLVVLKPDVGKGKQRRKLVVEALESKVHEIEQKWGTTIHVAGGPVLVAEAVRYLEQDGYTFLYATTTLLLIVLAILFRSPRWIALPLVVVHIGLIWTKALVYLSGVTLTMISSVLTAMVTVIGVATVMHATVRYRDLRSNSDPHSALHRTLCDVGVPTFWTAATTAVGFASLTICDIAPVRTFGTMMATAALLLWVVAAMIIPAVALFPGLGPDPKKAPGEDRAVRQLAASLYLVRHRPLLVSLCGLALALFLLIGWQRLRVETDFTRNFRQDAPVAVASRFVEERLGGTGVLEANFELQASELTRERIEQISAAAEEIGKVPGVTIVLALTDILHVARAALKQKMGRFGGFIPDSMIVGAARRLRPDLVDTFWNAQVGRMRIVVRAKERASAAQKERVIEQVRQITSKHLGQRGPATRKKGAIRLNASPDRANTELLKTFYARRGSPIVTGHYTLLHHLVGRLLEDQQRTFALASVGCLLCLSLAFRSWRLGLLAMVPNITPIAMVVGAMGWFGLPVNIATAMLAAVAIGMAVDSSIHYIYRFCLLRRQGLSFEEALEQTHQSVGLALLFANSAIVIGFSALTLSNFIPTIHFGILVSIALLGGLFGNLFLLPLLLRIRPLNPYR